METNSKPSLQNIVLGILFLLGFVAIILFISQNDAADTAATGKQLQSDVFFDEGRSYFED